MKIWLRQDQIAELYATTQQNISQHIASIISDRELDDEATHKKFLLVRTEGKRKVKRNIDNYNLDMIIALGPNPKTINFSSFDEKNGWGNNFEGTKLSIILK